MMANTAAVPVAFWSKLNAEAPVGLPGLANAGLVGVHLVKPAQVGDCVSVPMGINVSVIVSLAPLFRSNVMKFGSGGNVSPIGCPAWLISAIRPNVPLY